MTRSRRYPGKVALAIIEACGRLDIACKVIAVGIFSVEIAFDSTQQMYDAEQEVRPLEGESS